MEQAYDTGVHVHGLTKRLRSAIQAGTPDEVTAAWAGALTSMSRHFRVRDSYCPGVSSSTGLAEGCALSCFGLLDQLFHVWAHWEQPGIQTMSYVDNL